jgi:peptide/nickel transport system permease protein
MEIIIARPGPLPFVAVGIFLSFTLGILLGAFLGWNRTPNWVSNTIVPPLLVLSAVPQFLVALVLIFVVAFKMKLLPMNGAYPRTMVSWGSLVLGIRLWCLILSI